MQSHRLPHEATPTPASTTSERRKNPRFEMQFPVLFRAIGDPWTGSETANLSATGTFILSDRPFLLNTPVEYVLTFPPGLTKAPEPLFVRFFGIVLRCERIADGSGLFGIAVRKSAYRYLTREEAAGFDAIVGKISLQATAATDSVEAAKLGT